MPGSSELRAHFLAFLAKPPIRSFITELTSVGDHLAWQSYDGNGRLMSGTVLTSTADETDAPIAWALMNLNEGGTQTWGQDSRYAELVLLVQPRDAAGQPAPPVRLERWRYRLIMALGIPEVFAAFLDRNGMQTYDDPPAQFGVRLETSRGLDELIDSRSLKRIPGSATSNSMLSYGVADREGEESQNVALVMLRLWCDHGLYVDGYETELAKLRC